MTIVPFPSRPPPPPPPSDWALDVAIEFLRLNEAPHGEKEACHAVAAWIEAITGLRRRRPL